VHIPPEPSRDDAYDAGEIVAAACARGLPLAWIHAGNRTPGTLEPTSLDDAQGTVTDERIPQAAQRDEP
jgi:hypothetical protein